MYLVSYFEESSFVEASLGGKLTQGELAVFEQELLDVVDSFGGRPYHLLLDYSRARGLDADLFGMLACLRDACLKRGAQKIVSVTVGEADLQRETSGRLQNVMEGREAYVLDPAYAKFDALHEEAAVTRAA